MNAYPKPVRIKSKALTDSARDRDCTLRMGVLCRSENVVFCHVRGPGDGIGTKPPDFWGYYGCGYCHRLEEAGFVQFEHIMRAIRETQTIMARNGLLTVKGWKP